MGLMGTRGPEPRRGPSNPTPLRWPRCRGEGWRQVESAQEAELLSQLQEGEFWMEEDEFLSEFDELTVGYPVTAAGHLQSLHTGSGWVQHSCLVLAGPLGDPGTVWQC